ncbi:hypothetical protein DAPPUDRAFT_313567 [Daphnia pulex]|uniref:DNA/RNA non-specific endonuclease domain-containing protein n=1 Tax=Daphnia pulex TaxID=6669 RepID=E9G3H7_DAPPU|nr:hypothetical protein DAPPUDRAFT_313567 [Daphnia pulex]|eukprot:EFX85987.1 hypothetical protein DAPPUDRAFT_313567 [Daphnia pulex]
MAITKKLLAVVLLIACLVADPVSAVCTFNLDTSSPTYPPHFVDSSNNIIQPTLQNGVRTITLAASQSITVACEGTNNFLMATNAQFNSGKCATAGTNLQIGTQNLGYSSLGCNAVVKETIKETGTCSTTGTKIEIGWQVNSAYINQLTVCHVQSNDNTLYAIHTIYGANAAADDKANARPSFRKGNYFVGVDVETAYSQAGQLVTVSDIVGSSTLGAQYIDTTKSYYFARGHLAPDGDFIDAGSQDATYYYINAAPQWQSFNNGNWKALEAGTRDLAISRVIDVVVYTGTFETLTLADVKGVQKPIYLAKDGNNNNVLPAPKYYWKVVHDPASNKATAFIGINNPHLTSVSGADVFCTDVCSQVGWMSWSNRFDIPKGYMFCCTAAGLHNVVAHAPNLGSIGLLV